MCGCELVIDDLSYAEYTNLENSKA